MKAPRFYIEEELVTGSSLQLTDDISRHIKALRLSVGDQIVLFDGQGGEFDAEVTETSRRSTTVYLLAHQPIERESPLTVHLAISLIRKDAMEVAIQKATELGVSTITPLVTRFTNESVSKARMRQSHWQRIVNAACEQCGRNRPAIVSEPVEFSNWLNGIIDSEGIKIILDPRSTENFSDLPSPQESAILAIGPEGGFSDDEIAEARQLNFVNLSLGPRVLRAETAPIAALTLVQHVWGDLSRSSSS